MLEVEIVAALTELPIATLDRVDIDLIEAVYRAAKKAAELQACFIFPLSEVDGTSILYSVSQAKAIYSGNRIDS